jgi:putative methionine-R-sulfoxide reductase with GAF domain
MMAGPGDPAEAPLDTERKLRELSFLHEFSKLLTTARNWDELMRTIVDRTTDALGVEVCSVYLMERDAARLRLAATNGLDRDQIGTVTLALGEGLTGSAAEIGQPIASPDVRADPRFKWVPGFDQSQFVSMLSVPMPWNDTIIGVINVQATETRMFTPEEVEFLVTIGALLGGIVEKGRLQAEAEEQLETLTALDGARAELLAVVTHELRTPLAVVRAYLDLLADAAVDAASASGPAPDSALVQGWRDQAIGQVTRLDRLVDSILASVRGEGLAAGLARVPHRPRRQRHDQRNGPSPARAPTPPDGHLGCPVRRRRRRPFPPGSGTPPGERGQVLAGGRVRQRRHVQGQRRDPGLCHRRRPRHPGAGVGVSFRSLRADRKPTPRFRNRPVCGP